MGKGTSSARKTSAQWRPLPKGSQGFVLRSLLCLQQHTMKYKEAIKPYVLGTAQKNPPPAPSPHTAQPSPSQSKGAGNFTPEQTNTVITKPRALTSAPSLDPKAGTEGPVLPSLGMRSWALVGNSALTLGTSRIPVSNCLSSPVWAQFPAGTN